MSLGGRTVLFGIFLAAVTAWSTDVVRRLYEYSRAEASASHLVLIPLVSIALVYQNRARVFSDVSMAWRSGVALVLATAVLVTAGDVGNAGASLELGVAGLLAMWLGGFLLFYGRHAIRKAGFALCFLFLTIPIPATVLAWLIHVLKVGSTETVAALYALTGTAYHREGSIFTLPGLVLEIADDCSGIRSTIALALSALLVGHWSLRSPWARVLLLAAVFPISVLKNAIRIVSLSLLSVHVDSRFLTGRLHNDGGILFFLMALALLISALAVLRRLERRAFGSREALSQEGTAVASGAQLHPAAGE